MDRAPSFQFYPADWQNDLKLQVCSMAAQGLLINLMCLMHQSEKYGYLLVNGAIKPSKVVSKLLRLSPRTYDSLLNELITEGVLTRAEDGAIFCKRMVKDQIVREQRREAGAKGGNPKLVNPKVNPEDNQSAKQNTPPSSSSSSSRLRDSSESLGEEPSPPAPPPASDKIPKCPQKDILLLYHQKFHDCPRIVAWNGNNEKAMQTRWREAQERQSLAWWEEFFDGIRGSPFLCGVNDRGWRAKLPWIVKLENFNKILNGEYRDETPRTGVDPEDDPRNYSPEYKRLLAERAAAQKQADRSA